MKCLLKRTKQRSHFGLMLSLSLILAVVLAACGGDDGSSHGNDGTTTFSVTYDGNGAEGGSAPVDDTAYEEGEPVTVLGNTGNLVRNGYAFSGWNTQADASGTTYTQGQTFTMEAADVILYARWTTNPTYIVSYDGNGADSGSVPVDTTHYEEGQEVTVLGNTGSLARDGYLLAGWNTQPGGGGTSYTTGQTFTMGTADVILYARWIVPGEAGSLDTSFGGTGFVTTVIDGMAEAMVIQDDGKILVAGSGDDATVVRYNPDGTLDDSFGTGGIVTLPADFVKVTDMAIEPGDSDDFRIVLAGIGSSGGTYRMSAARLNANGGLDTSFAGDGIFHSSFTSNGSYGAQGVAIDADRKIVLAGETSGRFAVIRLTTNGDLDTTFGSPNGWVTTVIQDNSHATAVAIQDDGKIVVAGQSYLDGFTNFAASIARYNTDGTLDSDEWGAGYILSTYISEPTALVIRNGRVVIAGGHLSGSFFEFAMLGFDSIGWLDSTFGEGGYVATRIGDDATPYAMAAGADGIMLAGNTRVGTEARLAVARYSADGELDTIFGSPDGYVLTELGTSPYPYGLALDALGRIVVAGGQGSGTSAYFVVRYMP